MYSFLIFSGAGIRLCFVFPLSFRSVCVRPRRGDHCHLPWIYFHVFTEDVNNYLYCIMTRGELVFVSPYGTNYNFNYDNEFLVPP